MRHAASRLQAAYEEALSLARQQHGPLHGMVEKVKYEMSAFLGGSGREVRPTVQRLGAGGRHLGDMLVRTSSSTAQCLHHPAPVFGQVLMHQLKHSTRLTWLCSQKRLHLC
jgi:hypothetical protein